MKKSSSGSNASLKIQLDIPNLEPPWLAYVHRGRDNMVFFYNLESRISLWKEEFVSSMRGKMNIPDIDLAIHSALINLNSRMAVPTSNYSSDSVMEIDSAPARKSSKLLKGSMSELRQSLDQTVSDSEIYFICIFDTSALMHDPSRNLLKRCVRNKVACVFPYELIRELDKLKMRDCGREHKARYVIRQIEDCEKEHPDLLYRENSIQADCNSVILNGQAVNFAVHCPDDKMLKCAISFVHDGCQQRGDKASDQIFFVTEDRNLRQKALGHFINVLTTQELLSQLDELNHRYPTSNLKQLFDGYRMQSRPLNSSAKAERNHSRPKPRKGSGTSSHNRSLHDQLHASPGVQFIERPASAEPNTAPKSYPGRYADGSKHPVEYNGCRPQTMPKRYSFDNDNYYPCRPNVNSMDIRKPIQKKSPLKTINTKTPSSSLTPKKALNNDNYAAKKPKSISTKNPIKCAGTAKSLTIIKGNEPRGSSLDQPRHIQPTIDINSESSYVQSVYPESQKFISCWRTAVDLAVTRLGNADIQGILTDLNNSVQRFLFNGYEESAFEQVVLHVMVLHHLCVNDNQVIDSKILVQEVTKQGTTGEIVNSCKQFFDYIRSVAEQFKSA